MSTIVSVINHKFVSKKKYFIQMQNKKETCGRMRELMKNMNRYLEFIFDHIIWKKLKPTKFANFAIFLVFYEFLGFPAKIVRPISSQRNDRDGWFFTTNTTFQALQDRIPFVRFGGTCVFFWEKLHGIGPQE